MSTAEKEEPTKKLSQRRIDRQQRKAERQRLRQKKIDFDDKKQQSKVIHPSLSKKSLPGFLAKNVDAIIKWLRDYEHLFCLAEDYGFQRLDIMPEETRHRLVQQYVDISEFITMCENLKNEATSKQTSEKLDQSEKQTNLN